MCQFTTKSIDKLKDKNGKFKVSVDTIKAIRFVHDQILKIGISGQQASYFINQNLKVAEIRE